KMTVCPECGSKYISGFKAGTEQVEETVKKMYPEARVLRMDADTTRQKDSYEKILSSFLNKEADILIGTQMIVKGHDFKNVTLVGVLAADQTLFDADYKAAERTFDLITQAAGRAGRGDVPGDVVIQTYKPDHYAIVHAASQDYKAFYEEEIAYRDFLNYPPTGHMLSVLVTGKDEEETGKFTDQMCKALKKYFDSTVIGPAPAFISKLNDIYRFVFYIKNVDYDKLVEIKDYLEDNLSRIKKKNTLVFFDFDPYGMQ
ncbi:MAG: primosomal protein N', partial [Lachnospiraceae bacterium]|nr:primosomal protein N' [Lachnospiraceae bacterium]